MPSGFFLANILLLTPYLVLVVMASRRQRQAQDSQNEALDMLTAGQRHCMVPVNIARPAYLADYFKICNFETKGILLIMADQLRIIGRFPDGQPIDRIYLGQDANLQWTGTKSGLQWLSLGPTDAALLVAADRGFPAAPARQALLDLFQGKPLQFPLPNPPTRRFALEKNRAAMQVIILFFALAAYALIDGRFVNQHALIKTGVASLGIVPLLFFAVPTYFFLHKGKVPMNEAMGLSLLAVIGLVLAYTPLMMRADQWLASNGVQQIAYLKKDETHFEAISVNAPHPGFDGAKPYWSQFKPGTTHYFGMIHGPLGLWQLDHPPLDVRYREFERAHKNPTSTPPR